MFSVFFDRGAASPLETRPANYEHDLARTRAFMASECFFKPRLTGDRFSSGEIPLEVLADIAVLSEMFVEVAKWKFRQKNPLRQRVPRGFADGVSFKLTAVENGSAVPVIALVTAASTLFPLSEAYSYFEYFSEARQAIVDAVGAAEAKQSITSHLPEPLLGYFDRFGRNLAEGEAIELTVEGSSTPSVRLTKETRRRLVLASSSVKEFTEETSVHGLVHEFDQRNKTFQMTLPDGGILGKIPVEDQHYEEVLKASNGFRSGVRVRVYGIGRFDRNNELRGVEKVEHVTILDPLDVRARITELKLLEAGWMDGEGLALSHEGLDWIADSFDSSYPNDLVLPRLFPTLEGKVLAEWSLETCAPSLEIRLAEKQGEWHSINFATGEESVKIVDLTSEADWKWMAEQIRTMGGDAQ